MRRLLSLLSVCLLVSQLTTQVLQGEELSVQVSRLDRLRPGEERDQAIAELAKGKDVTTDEIEKQMADRSQDFGWVHTSVRVLQQINSEKSRALLKKLALDEIDLEPPNLNAWAARALIDCDRKEIKSLLSTSNDEVLEAAILGLRDHGLNQELMEALSPHIQSKNPDTRWRAAGIMASEAPAGELAGQALKYIKSALEAVATIPNLNEIDPSSGHLNYRLTVAESHYQRYMSQLFQLRVENDALGKLSDELQSRARETVLLALALRKEPKVHDQIARLAQDPDVGMFRAWAVSALAEYSRPQDLPLLRVIARNDPLQRGGGGDVFVPAQAQNPDAPYPVRMKAAQAVKSIERAHEHK